MRRLSSWTGLAPQDRGASVAIGNFDGVHLGHRHVIELARARAGAGVPLGIVTFEPHPRQFFAPAAPPFRLMNAEARASRLARLGVDCLYELPFDAGLAGLDPRAFAREVLVAGLGVRHVVVGADFRFGCQRAGSAQTLAELGAELGFATTIAPLLAEGAVRVSSSAIRRALAEGRPREAAAMLGHWHRIEGPVIGGERRGRSLGFPTANMTLAGLHLPRLGIYATRVDVLEGPHRGSYLGASSIGTRPTFGESAPNLETYLLDFTGDLYGAHLSVALVEFLRPELKFSDVPALVAQMHQDCARAREVLAAP